MKKISQKDEEKNKKFNELMEKINSLGKQFNIGMLNASERVLVIQNLRQKAREVYLDKRESDQMEIFEMR